MALKDTVQELADVSRLLKAGLRSHDPEAVGVAISRLEANYGAKMAESKVMATITSMMTSEGWSFFDEQGDASPLL